MLEHVTTLCAVAVDDELLVGLVGALAAALGTWTRAYVDRKQRERGARQSRSTDA